MTETLVNQAPAVLAASVASVDTSFTRTSTTTGWPGDSNGASITANFRCVMTDGINYEIVLVNGGFGTDILDIDRAVEPTNDGVQEAFDLAVGSTVTPIATAEFLLSLGGDDGVFNSNMSLIGGGDTLANGFNTEISSWTVNVSNGSDLALEGDQTTIDIDTLGLYFIKLRALTIISASQAGRLESELNTTSVFIGTTQAGDIACSYLLGSEVEACWTWMVQCTATPSTFQVGINSIGGIAASTIDQCTLDVYRLQ